MTTTPVCHECGYDLHVAGAQEPAVRCPDHPGAQIDWRATPPWVQVSVPRDGDCPLTFRGALLADQCGDAQHGIEHNRYYHLLLYQVDDGRLVVVWHYRTHWGGEPDHWAVQVVPTWADAWCALQTFDPTHWVVGYRPLIVRSQTNAQYYIARQAHLEDDLRKRYAAQLRVLAKHLHLEEPLAPLQADADVRTVFDAYWRDRVCPAGQWDLGQVQRELYDYHTCLEEVTHVYDILTDGRFTKPTTRASVILDHVCAAQEAEIADAVQQALTPVVDEVGFLLADLGSVTWATLPAEARLALAVQRLTHLRTILAEAGAKTLADGDPQ